MVLLKGNFLHVTPNVAYYLKCQGDIIYCKQKIREALKGIFLPCLMVLLKRNFMDVTLSVGYYLKF